MSPALVRAAVLALRRGEVIAYPTETTYGLGCDPRNAKAVAKIFRIKQRDKKHPVLLVASSSLQAKKVVHLTGMMAQLAQKNWPGALTLVLPARPGTRLAPQILLKGNIAVRVSSYPFVQALTKAYGFPIVSTSANISGEPDARSGRAVARTFQNRPAQPDVVIDMGSLPKRKPSTIVEMQKDGTLHVLRQGAVRISYESH